LFKDGVHIYIYISLWIIEIPPVNLPWRRITPPSQFQTPTCDNIYNIWYLTTTGDVNLDLGPKWPSRPSHTQHPVSTSVRMPHPPASLLKMASTPEATRIHWKWGIPPQNSQASWGIWWRTLSELLVDLEDTYHFFWNPHLGEIWLQISAWKHDGISASNTSTPLQNALGQAREPIPSPKSVLS